MRVFLLKISPTRRVVLTIKNDNDILLGNNFFDMYGSGIYSRT